MLSLLHRATVIALSGAASLVFTIPAAAQNGPLVVRGLPPGTEMQIVPYGDLNLNFPGHRNILFNRVGRAVHNVCDFTGNDRFSNGYRLCANGAWDGAIPQMHRAYAQAAYYRR